MPAINWIAEYPEMHTTERSASILDPDSRGQTELSPFFEEWKIGERPVYPDRHDRHGTALPEASAQRSAAPLKRILCRASGALFFLNPTPG